MTDSKFIDKGVTIVKEAVQMDTEEKFEEALRLYEQALQYFMMGLKYEKNDKAKVMIRNKINEYMKRAEAIKEHLKGEEERAKGGGKKAVAMGGGAGGAAKKKGDGSGAGGDEEDPEVAKLTAAISQAIVSETPNVHWDDVAGLEQAKSLLKEAVILPIKFPQLFTGKRTPWRGILLYGPPGTGKSYLAKAVATEAGASTFLSVSSSDLVSKYQGESERLVRALFELARAKSPSIIFIDEVDSLCSARGEGENESARRIKTEFLVQMQGVGKGNDGVLVLGATNVPWELDPAIRRRFEKRVYVPLPEKNARKTMFKIHLGSTPNDLDDATFDLLADRTEGFSGSDISVVVRDALYEPVRTCQMATHFRKIPAPAGEPRENWKYEPCAPSDPSAEEMSLMDIASEKLHPPVVSRHDFERVLANAKSSVGANDLVRQEEWTREYGQEG